MSERRRYEHKEKLSLPGEAGDPNLLRRFHAMPLGAQYVYRVERLAEATKDPVKKAKYEHARDTMERCLESSDRPHLAAIRAWVLEVRVIRPKTVPSTYGYND